MSLDLRFSVPGRKMGASKHTRKITPLTTHQRPPLSQQEHRKSPMEPHDPAYFHWSAPVGLSTAGQRFNRGSVRGQGHEVGAPENDELS